MQNNLSNYMSRSKRSSDFLKHSITTSVKDIYIDSKHLIESPGPTHLFQFTKDIIGSSSWVINSFIKHLLTITCANTPPIGILNDDEAQFIVNKVSKNIKLDTRKFPTNVIFEALYRELEYSYLHPHYKSKLHCPKIFPTIVLVSGMLNEVYKTAAFERGVQNIAKKNGLRYFVPKISGVKSSEFNSGEIADQLIKYSKKNPDEKFWFFTYSKGGIDVLYFLRNHSSWASKNVAGISTLATPILGSKHLSKPHLKTASFIEQFVSKNAKSFLNLKMDFFSHEFQKSISEHQKSWFLNNYHLLPDNLFYTSLALGCSWYEGHIYMMLAKLLFPSDSINDGVVDAESAIFPSYFNGINLGTYRGHHLIAAQSSSFSQEALIEAHLILLKYLHLI